MGDILGRTSLSTYLRYATNITQLLLYALQQGQTPDDMGHLLLQTLAARL